jgi:hypothetical protein
MAPRFKYVCPSKTCRREIEIEIPSIGSAGEVSRPKCTCGETMKKVYSPPVLFKLFKAEVPHHHGEFETDVSS